MLKLKSNSILVAVILATSLSTSIAYARPAGAPIGFYDQTLRTQGFAPCMQVFPNNDLTFKNAYSSQWAPTELCSSNFAVLYSKATKTPLVVVEKLNAASVADAKGEDRTDNFYPDPRLKSQDSASLADYKGSGFDRGHMSPAANAIDSLTMNQTFALSNMVPQDSTNNRKVWSKLESDVRKYAARATGDVFVYTGPIFHGNVTKIGRGQVWVPSHLFKVVYDQKKGEAWGWVLPNSSEAKLGKPMSYSEFVKLTGITLINK